MSEEGRRVHNWGHQQNRQPGVHGVISQWSEQGARDLLPSPLGRWLQQQNAGARCHVLALAEAEEAEQERRIRQGNTCS